MRNVTSGLLTLIVLFVTLVPNSASAQCEPGDFVCETDLCFRVYERSKDLCERIAKSDLLVAFGEVALGCLGYITGFNLAGLILCISLLLLSVVQATSIYLSFESCMNSAEMDLDDCLSCV